MRKTVLALIAGLGLLLLGLSSLPGRTADMSLIGRPAATQSLIVQVQMNNDAKSCGRQCRRLTGLQLKKCYCTCTGGFWWYPNGPCW